MFDVAIIGAGIIGLAAAREVLLRHPETSLTVLEKEPELGRHQTGHNSGVIHSGIYYAPGSVKARACVAGAAALKRYCLDRGIPFEECGKVIVARNEDEIPRLEELHRRGIENGVPGLERIGPERIRELEPHVVGIQGLWSPRTGIIDFGRVAAAYADDVRAAGGTIATRHEVLGFQRTARSVVVRTTSGDVEASRVVACAGLYADRIAALTGAPKDPRIVPFRGDYYVLPPERRQLVRSLIYPVPDPAFPFLGVHFTRRIDGDVWLGPNAVLAFAREGYRRTDFAPGDLAEALGFPGFRKLAVRYWRTGLAEMWRDYNKAAFLASLRAYVPELKEVDLQPGPSGVRAQALSSDGKLVDDFVVNTAAGVLHVRNAPSPAATASLAIGAMIADALDAVTQ
ncbi:MAG TPA: L-2-hydroxyglutarate oxidase [Chloroflexota bacterium]|nr:L-2-hydroxyglutarate oxidase [Chloroflexota bacterium]